MFDIFSEYAIDPKAEQEGRWFPLGTGRVLVARANNPAYNRMIAARYESFKHVLDKKDSDEAIAEGKRRSNLIMAEVMATTVLLGWEGLGYRGKPIEYSLLNAQILLKHEEFQRTISTIAGEFRNYRYALEADDAKNSESISAGTSSGEASSNSSSS